MYSPLSEQLKHRTSPYHRQLDQLPVLKSLLSPSLSAREYETAMLYFYHCFNQWQPVLAQAAEQWEPPTFAYIDNQLGALTAEVNNFKHSLTAALSVPTPIIPNIEVYLGYSYVLTGSQIGARFILKRLQKSTLAQHYGFDYYRQLSQDTIDIKQWKAQLDNLVKQGQVAPQTIIDGAIQCFTQLISCFEQESTLTTNRQKALAPA
jgi:heme oxygenase